MCWERCLQSLQLPHRDSLAPSMQESAYSSSFIISASMPLKSTVHETRMPHAGKEEPHGQIKSSSCAISLLPTVSTDNGVIDGRGIEGADELHCQGAVRFLLRIILQVPVATKESTRESSRAARAKEWCTVKRHKGVLNTANVSASRTDTAKNGDFKVGDRIRGRWVLDNGKCRWFPGQITAIKGLLLQC